MPNSYPVFSFTHGATVASVICDPEARELIVTVASEPVVETRRLPMSSARLLPAAVAAAGEELLRAAVRVADGLREQLAKRYDASASLLPFPHIKPDLKG